MRELGCGGRVRADVCFRLARVVLGARRDCNPQEDS